LAAACCCLASCCCYLRRLLLAAAACCCCLLLLLAAAACCCCCCKGLAAEAAPSGRREARSLRDCSACTTLPSKTKNFTGHRTQKAVSPQNLNFESKAADLRAVREGKWTQLAAPPAAALPQCDSGGPCSSHSSLVAERKVKTSCWTMLQRCFLPLLSRNGWSQGGTSRFESARAGHFISTQLQPTQG